MENKQFEEWFKDRYLNSDGNAYVDINDFMLYEDVMQWGVYLEFFDSKDIHVEVWLNYEFMGDKFLGYYADVNETLSDNDSYFKSRKEAQQEAIKKAFEILELSEAGKKGAKAGEEMRDKLLGK